MQDQKDSPNSVAKSSESSVLPSCKDVPSSSSPEKNTQPLNLATTDSLSANEQISKESVESVVQSNEQVSVQRNTTDNETVVTTINKTELLPSGGGILPGVDLSNGANSDESNSTQLPSHIDSVAVSHEELCTGTSTPVCQDSCNAAVQKDPTSSINVTDPSEVAHKVKRIKWKDSEVPIITQNNNGPCPLLAILNAMILKGKIILPRDRQELSGGELVSIVGNAVFDVPRSSVPSEMSSYLEQNTQDAVSILHKLLTGLDVNIKFSGVKDFEFTSELSIFDVLDVSLYHGWVVDPTSEAASIVSNLSYNQLTNYIIMWRDQANSKKDDSLLLKAMLCEEFICESVSQLTIHGLFELGAALSDEEVAVLFRNNHFSTIYKRKGQLYQLLTDQGFLLESAVWETLTDIDATFSEFVNGAFQPIHQESNEEDLSNMTKEQQIHSDHQLAAMLQQEAEKQQRREEDFSKIVEDLGLHNLSDEEIARRLQNRENQLAEEANRSSPPVSTSEPTTQPSRPYSQPHLPTDHHTKGKKDCTIL